MDIKSISSENINAMKVHRILAHSYLIYFGVFVFGVLLDFFLGTMFFMFPGQTYVGVVLVWIGSYLLYWAQKTSRRTHKKRNSEERVVADFMRGPYKYTRTPSQWGLMMMVLGFGLLVQSMVVVVLAVIVFILMKLTFIRKEENRLYQKYGEVYMQYKKTVRC